MRSVFGAAALAVASLLFGCSNPVCDPAIVERLLGECSLVIGASPVCPGRSEAERLSDLVDTCNAAAPSGDAECYRTESCEMIGMGACIDRDGANEEVDPQCLNACLLAQLECIQRCEVEAEGEACVDCGEECGVTQRSCRDAC